MQTPPFQLARTNAHGHRDACCQPTEADLRTSRRRARLAELDSHLHCSVIGTCLSTGELRKLVPKFTDLDRYHASDLEIHHAAVELAIAGGAGAKALNKALDERYSGAIRRFEAARDSEALLDLWNEALKSGDIPPAYWAVMSHPHASIEVRQSAFGELHMLSHLVGAANRADIRRLVALEEENQTLRDKIERQQARLLELSAERDASVRQSGEHALQLAALAERKPDLSTAELEAEVERLRAKVDDGERRLALHTSRREAAEQRTQQDEEQTRALRNKLGEAQALLKIVQAECAALERATLDAAAQPDGQPDARRRAVEWLNGKRIVYVGGRPNSNAVLKSLVEAAGGELNVHDGGIEDRKGLLAAALPNADVVLFPVDCIDHDSMNMLKRVCERHGVEYAPLRTASVASFVEFVARLNASAQAARTGSPPPSAFCLRHG
ncbi:peptidase [Caballeronia peredens]|nr:peptidase [Caballeronia peredens]